MKLNQTQISALASKITREINDERTAKHKIVLAEKIRELQMKFDADCDVVKATLSRVSLLIRFQVSINGKDDHYSMLEPGTEIKEKHIKDCPLKLVTFDTIKEDIILTTIEETDINSLINTIKNKYVTN